LNAKANSIIRALIDESNFACHETVEGTPGIIEWVADDTALVNAREYLKEFRTSVSPEEVEHVGEHSDGHSTNESVEHPEALPS
jgi:hypothetical protein